MLFFGQDLPLYRLHLSMGLVLLMVGCIDFDSSYDQHNIVLLEDQTAQPGTVLPTTYMILRNAWHQDLETGDTLDNGTHFEFDEALLPEGTSLKIEITDNNEALFHLDGQIKAHHINDSLQIPLTFKKEAFFAASDKAFDRQPRQVNLHIQFGQGYKLSGDVEGVFDQPIVLKELSSGEQIHIEPGQTSWSMEDKIEVGETFTLQVESHPTDKCCYVSQGDGVIMDRDLKDIRVTCTHPQWEDAADLTQNLSKQAAQGTAYTMDPDRSKLSHNPYGDTVLLWQKALDDSSTSELQGFVSFFNANTGAWVHPGKDRWSQLLQVGLINPRDQVQAKTRLGLTKDFNLGLFKQTNDATMQNLFDWYGQDPLFLKSQLSVGFDHQAQAQENLNQDAKLAKTLYRQGNRYLFEVLVEEDQGSFVFSYAFHQDYMFERGAYNTTQKVNLASIEERNYQGIIEPYIDGAINQAGDGFVMWKEKQAQVSDGQNLYLTEIRRFHAKASGAQHFQLNRGEVFDGPKFVSNAQGDHMIVWLEKDQDKLILHRASKKAEQKFWLNSADPNHQLDPVETFGGANLAHQVHYQLVQNENGDWANVYHHGTNHHIFGLLFGHHGLDHRRELWQELPEVSETQGLDQDDVSMAMAADGTIHLGISLWVETIGAKRLSHLVYMLPKTKDAFEPLRPQSQIVSAVDVPDHFDTRNFKNKIAASHDGRVQLVFQKPTFESRLEIVRLTKPSQSTWQAQGVPLDHLDPIQVIGDADLIDVGYNKKCGQSVIFWQAQTTSGSQQLKSVRR